MQYLKQSFFPVHSYNKKREPTKDEAEPRRVVWRGVDAYLGRADRRKMLALQAPLFLQSCVLARDLPKAAVG